MHLCPPSGWWQQGPTCEACLRACMPSYILYPCLARLSSSCGARLSTNNDKRPPALALPQSDTQKNAQAAADGVADGAQNVADAIKK